MLRKETVEARTLDLIYRLMTDQNLTHFSLVGGTALALKIGHRRSIDIDLFTPTAFEATVLAEYLKTNYSTSIRETLHNSIFCMIEGVKVDLFAHQYPLVAPVETIESVRMWSLRDIAAMKLNAIHGNGTRLKDYIDVYSLLEHLSLGSMMESLKVKYPEISLPVMIQCLLYHEDIRKKEPVDFIGPAISWETIANRLEQACQSPHRVFLTFRQQRKPNPRVAKHDPKRNRGKRR